MLLRNSQLRWGMLVRNSSGRGPMVVRSDNSYNPKFVKMYAAQNRVSYEEAGLVAIGLICGDRPFFPKRFKQFRIAVPLPMGDEYLVATLDAQDVLFVRNMKDASQVARYLAPSVKKVGSAEIPKNRKKK